MPVHPYLGNIKAARERERKKKEREGGGNQKLKEEKSERAHAFFATFGSRALYLEQREIFKMLLNNI